MGNIKRLSHLCIRVSDIEKAERFYVGVLGMTVVNRDLLRGKPLVVLGEGLGLTLTDELGDMRIIDHIGLRVTSIKETTTSLEKAGVPLTRGPVQSPYGTSIYFQDPDGNTVECHDADRK